MLAVLTYPEISPEIFSIGPFAVRWYALAYIAGLLLGLWYIQRLSRFAGEKLFAEMPLTKTDANDLLLWATLGIILGGRVGYVVFYQTGYFLNDPLQIFAVWNGGMSFHGGFLGVVAAVIWFTSRREIELLKLGDLLACVAPIGLLLGRLANFVNGELFGRPTDVAWAMVFPRGGPVPRHPSQLYEAALEGLLLLVLIGALYRFTSLAKRPGTLTGLFFAGYGSARFFVELFREPDAQLGYLWGGATMGQLLSLPMIAAGIAFMVVAKTKQDG